MKAASLRIITVLFPLFFLSETTEGFEPFDYEKVPFPEEVTAAKRDLQELASTLALFSKIRDLSEDQRARLLAAARRGDPLCWPAFSTEYKLKVGDEIVVTGTGEEGTRELLREYMTRLESKPEFGDYLAFIDAAIKGEPLPEEPELSSSAGGDAPTVEVSPVQGKKAAGYLSTLGCRPVTVEIRSIGLPAFQFVPNQLDSAYFQSAYRESLKFLGLSHSGSLTGKRLTFSVEEDLDKSEGPGATLAAAVLTRAVAGKVPILEDAALVGDVNADGTIQPLGDLLDRLLADPGSLARVIVVPRGDRASLDDLLILHGHHLFSKTQIFEVSTLDEAFALVSGERSSRVRKAIDQFAEIQEVLNKPGGGKFIYNGHVQRRLDRVSGLAGNHLSARQLKFASLRRTAPHLSLDGSFGLIFDALKPVLGKDREIRKSGHLDPDAYARLKQFQSKIDPSLRKLTNAVIAFETSGRVGANSVNERARVTQRLKEELNAVSRNVQIREKMM